MQWQSTCLAFLRPWVQVPAPQKKKNEKELRNVKNRPQGSLLTPGLDIAL